MPAATHCRYFAKKKYGRECGAHISHGSIACAAHRRPRFSKRLQNLLRSKFPPHSEITLQQVKSLRRVGRRLRRALASGCVDEAVHLWLLENKPDRNIRRRIAMSAHATASVLSRVLASCEDDNVIAQWAVRHPAASTGILRQISQDWSKDFHINIYLAENRNSPWDVLEPLTRPAARGRYDVWLIRNPNLPLQTLEQIVKQAAGKPGGMENVRYFAEYSERPEFLNLLYCGINGLPCGDEIRFHAISNIHADTRTLEAALYDPDEAIRAQVAHHPNLPEEASAFLASDKSERVRRAVARSERTPADILTLLALDSSNKRIQTIAASALEYRRSLEDQQSETV